MVSVVHQITTTISFLNFLLNFNLITSSTIKDTVKRQQVIYCLIILLREEGLGYMKIVES